MVISEKKKSNNQNEQEAKTNDNQTKLPSTNTTGWLLHVLASKHVKNNIHFTIKAQITERNLNQHSSMKLKIDCTLFTWSYDELMQILNDVINKPLGTYLQMIAIGW